jgi:hypothetical protein
LHLCLFSDRASFFWSIDIGLYQHLATVIKTDSNPIQEAGIMPPVTITAQGTSTIFRQAERAVIHVQVSSEGTSQEKVSLEVTMTANDLRTILNGLSPKTEKGMRLKIINSQDFS